MAEGPGISPITLLPEEMWELVFKNLTQNEALNARLVCKQWAREIEDHRYGFDVRLHEDFPFFEQILELGITKCTVWKFIRPPPLNPKRIFRHPDLIKELYMKCMCSAHRSEIISPHNLHWLLKSCSKNLEILGINLTEPLLNNPYYSTTGEKGYAFPNLTHLQIVISQSLLPNIPQRVKLSQENFVHRVLRLTTMSKLTTLKMYIDLRFSRNSAAWLSFELLSFLAKEGKLLENLEFVFVYSKTEGAELDDDVAVPQYDKIDLTLLKKADSLERFVIDESPDRTWNNAAENTLKNAWTVLMEQQTKLVHIQAHDLPVSSSCLRTILWNNHQSLRCVRIGTLSVIDLFQVNGIQKAVLDMSAFQNCQNLEEISLQSYDDDFESPQLQNLSRLPTQLKSLHLSQFSILSDDIREFTQSHEMLSSISYCACWEPADGFDYGVNGTVLEEMMGEQHVNLSTILIHGFNSTSPAEHAKLNEILVALGGVPLDNYATVLFQITRRPIIGAPWKSSLPPRAASNDDDEEEDNNEGDDDSEGFDA